MKRDFSLEAYERFRQAIIRNRDEFEEGFLLSNYGITQERLDFVRDYADISEPEYIINSYRRDVVQKYNDSLLELDYIFQNVYQVERDALAGIQAIKDKYASLVKELEALCELIRPVNGQMKLMTLPIGELKAYLLENTYNNEEAYDKLSQKKLFALLEEEEFSEEMWESLDEAGKQDLLIRLLARVQEIMGTSISAEIIFVPTESSLDPYGKYRVVANEIVLYSSLMEQGRDRAMRTLFHEVRHGYQYEAIVDWHKIKWLEEKDAGNFILEDGNREIIRAFTLEEGYEQKHLYVGENTAHFWFENFKAPVPLSPADENATQEEIMAQYKLYLESPIEYDTHAFSGLLDPKYTNETLLYSLEPTYQGSWDVPKKP